MGFQDAEKVDDRFIVGIGEENGMRGKAGLGRRFSEDIVFLYLQKWIR